MGNLLLTALIDGNRRNLGDGALVSVMAIILVFSILAIIILTTFLIGKAIEKYSKVEKKEQKPVATAPQSTNTVPVNLDDEDAIVATLVASIDFRQQTKKDIKVISVKEIK
jgi:Na+-transporting methylmalonyl-CoA/oxaloacetate decarboxylase gamma subunit